MIYKLNQGEIWLANLNPNKGIEPGKIRPVLILQDQSLLDIAHPSTLIVPLTTQLIENAYPLRVRVNSQDNLAQDSDCLIDQLRAIDNKRLIQGPLTVIAENKRKEIYNAICEVLGMPM